MGLSYFKEELRKFPSQPTNPCRYKPLVTPNHLFSNWLVPKVLNTLPTDLRCLLCWLPSVAELKTAHQLQLHPCCGARANRKILRYPLVSSTATLMWRHCQRASCEDAPSQPLALSHSAGGRTGSAGSAGSAVMKREQKNSLVWGLFHKKKQV